MAITYPTLDAAPIIEAVIDIECDMPPGFEVHGVHDDAAAALVDLYPVARQLTLSQHRLSNDAPDKPLAVTSRLAALQFVSQDNLQLVQFRPTGYSFNRLAPYEGLDNYIAEIERTWRIFIGLVRPIVSKSVRLRYINRLPLPLIGGSLDFDEYLKVGPRVADEARFSFAGFFDQQSLVERDTGNVANVVLATQPPEGEILPIVFDIEVAAANFAVDPDDWGAIYEKIASLRDLKNLVFNNSLTPKCLSLFRS